MKAFQLITHVKLRKYTATFFALALFKYAIFLSHKKLLICLHLKKLNHRVIKPGSIYIFFILSYEMGK